MVIRTMTWLATDICGIKQNYDPVLDSHGNLSQGIRVLWEDKIVFEKTQK